MSLINWEKEDELAQSQVGQLGSPDIPMNVASGIGGWGEKYAMEILWRQWGLQRSQVIWASPTVFCS